MASHAQIAESRVVGSSIAGLGRLAEGIGDPQVRNRGTIGGSLANNDPAADYPAAVLALNATLATTKRTIAADDFFRGLFATALADNEILTEITFPIPKRFAYAKFPNPASRFALVGVAVAATSTGVRVAATGAGASGVFRVPAMEAALSKAFTPEALSAVKVDTSGLTSDIHADAPYRAHLIGVMARRAVQAALH
jgi:carbon-monoxide dehydrogenase medium subunit